MEWNGMEWNGIINSLCFIYCMLNIVIFTPLRLFTYSTEES